MMTLEEQIAALGQLAHKWAVREAKQVRGAFTSGEYVEYQLRRILGPHAWSFTILQGPEIVTISETEAYAQVVGRLHASFADGSDVHQDAVGVWPLRASNARGGGTLGATSAERYEAVLKAACTDALKAAAERLGSCFRPLSDPELRRQILREQFRHAPSAASGDFTATDYWRLAGQAFRAGVSPGRIREIYDHADPQDWGEAIRQLREEMAQHAG